MNSHEPTSLIERLLEEMFRTIGDEGVCVVKPCGSFKLDRPLKEVEIVPKSVYGFAVELSEDEKTCLFNYARKEGHCQLESPDRFRPMFGNVYPLYWGEDKYIGHRIYHHIQGESKYHDTGSIRLSTYGLLRSKDILCGLAVVDKSEEAERALKNKYPDLLKTWTTAST